MRLFITLSLMIAYATANAVIYTPNLPELSLIFHVSANTMESVFVWFLAGYCLGQLVYSPLCNRFGVKAALFSGIIVQIVSTLVALLSCQLALFDLFITARFFSALGSGVGLMMTFTIASEHYDKDRVPTIISYLIPAFAVVPAICILLSEYFTQIFSWSASFYLAIIYGLVLIILCYMLPDSKSLIDRSALQVKRILGSLMIQLHRRQLVLGGIIMGFCVSYVYLFSSIVPFITLKYYKFDGLSYGMANGFSASGLFLGALLARPIQQWITLRYFSNQSTSEPSNDTSPGNASNLAMVLLGVLFNMIGSIGIFIGQYFSHSAFLSFFVPLFFLNFGSCFALSRASAMAIDASVEKADASSAMNFINVGITTLIILSFSFLPLNHYLLASTYVGISALMFVATWRLAHHVSP